MCEPMAYDVDCGVLHSDTTYRILYHCTTPGPEPESGEVVGRWYGWVDHCGKVEIVEEETEVPFYFFPYEFVSLEEV